MDLNPRQAKLLGNLLGNTMSIRISYWHYSEVSDGCKTEWQTLFPDKLTSSRHSNSAVTGQAVSWRASCDIKQLVCGRAHWKNQEANSSIYER